jgi:hypothetical protein
MNLWKLISLTFLEVASWMRSRHWQDSGQFLIPPLAHSRWWLCNEDHTLLHLHGHLLNQVPVNVKGSFWSALMAWQSNSWPRGQLGSRGVGWATPRSMCYLKQAPGYSPGVADVNKHSLSPPKIVCAWWRITSYERWTYLHRTQQI